MHYGKYVESDTPITGVLNTNMPEFLHEDTINGIDLDYEDYINETINNDPEGDNYEANDPTILIGFIKCKPNEKDIVEYEPDTDAEYSAICSDQYTQIVRSKWVSRTTLCSPCFPGQGDLDTAGDFLTFTLPPGVFGSAEHLNIKKSK